jgi:hypothetical protein
MELFGAKFCVALGAWKLRFVLMLEDDQGEPQAPAAQRPPHHFTTQMTSGAQARRI